MSETPVSSRPLSRPLSPRLSVYRWLPGMLASLMHRASGIALVLFVPFYLWLLHGMTGSPDDFTATYNWLHTLPGKICLWLGGTAYAYHFMNGIRFLMLDIGWGEGRAAMRNSARLVLVLAALISLLLAATL